MIIVPNRLFREDFVRVLLRTPQIVVLKKQLHQSVEGRQSYVARHVLITVMEGEQRIQQGDGKSITIQTGETAALRRGLYTVTDLISGGGTFLAYLIFFDEEIMEQTFSAYLPQHSAHVPVQKAVWTKLVTPSCIQFFWQSLEPWLQAVPSPSVMLQHIKVQEFFALLEAGEPAAMVSRMLGSQVSLPARNLRGFMEAHYDKPLSVADYAYLTGRSESTFRREFKAKFGTTPRRWIIRQRLEKAHALLQTTDEEVTQVAYEVGYENVSHFISEYKKHYGHTPKQHPALETIHLR